jgi:hypothetical protein
MGTEITSLGDHTGQSERPLDAINSLFSSVISGVIVSRDILMAQLKLIAGPQRPIVQVAGRLRLL